MRQALYDAGEDTPYDAARPEQLSCAANRGPADAPLFLLNHWLAAGPAVEDQARDRAWRIGQTRTVVSHRLVCPGTVDERVEEVVAGKRHIADLILPGSSSLADLDASQLRVALGLRDDELLTEDDE